jgi:GNAT superfamily N-acetyltransferase
MAEHEHHREGYTISTDKARLDVGRIHRYLSEESYWAGGRTREVVETSIEYSLCFGVYGPDDDQVGFARVVTDRATFAWICDLFILEAHRGAGLGKSLLETILADPRIKHVRRWMLATRDAHGLYRDYGDFHPLDHPDVLMMRVKENQD